LRGGVEVGAQLGERLELAERGQVEPQTAGHLFHGRYLSVPAHTRNGKADIDSGPDPGIKKVACI